MIDAKQIPDEVVEAAARAVYEAWCAFHGVTKTSMPWEDIDDEERQACIAEARASIAAALSAWPGMHTGWQCIGCGDDAQIILPLPQEGKQSTTEEGRA